MMRSAILEDAVVVGDDHDAALVVEHLGLDELDDLPAGVAVERRGRLVEEQDVGRGSTSRARDRDALLLAAAELAPAGAARARSSPTISSYFARRASASSHGCAAQDERNRDVLDRREPREQVIVLEHEADLWSRKSASAFSFSAQTSVSSTRTVARVGRRMPEIMLSSVVLPLPDGPTM